MKSTSINRSHGVEKRAKAIAAMGLVSRQGDHFEVSSPSLRANQRSFEVRRNEFGTVVCNCPEFLSAMSSGEPERCEHILAVKFALVEKNTETTAATAGVSIELSSANGVEGSSTKTESRRSERGEQLSEKVGANDSANGHVVSQTASPSRSGNM